MKIYKTESGVDKITSKAFIVSKGEDVELIQFDHRGKYVSKMEGISITEGNYAIDKTQFFNTLKVLGKELKIEAKKTKLVFSKDNTFIDLKLIEWDLPDIVEDKHMLKVIPENFLRIITKASKMTSKDNKSHKELNGIKIVGKNVYASNGYIVYKGLLNTDTDLDIIIPSDILKVVANPTHYDYDSNNNLVLTSVNGIATIRTIDGLYPVVALEKQLIDKPAEGNIFGSNAVASLRDALDDAAILGHKEILLSNKCVVEGVTLEAPKFKMNVNITIPVSAKFDIHLLRSALISNEAFCKGGTSLMYLFSTEQVIGVCPKILEKK